MTKVFVIGDIHFSESNKLAEPFIERVDKIMSASKYDACVLLGDVFHTHEKISEAALHMVVRLFKRITQHCHLYVLVGNHDYKDHSQFLSDRHSLVAFKEWPKVTVVDTPQVVKISKDAVVTMCPYVPKGRFIEALNTVSWRKTDMVFGHQEFDGAKDNGIVLYNGDKWSTKNPQVVSGHLHEKQNLAMGVYYPGAPFDHSYGYTGKRVVTEILFNKGDFKIRSIETGLPRKITVHKTIREAESYMPEGDDYVKMVVSGKREEFNEFLKTDHAKKLKKICGVSIIHKADDTEEVETLLQDRKLSKCETYRETLEKLVEKENNDVQSVYHKILR